MAIAEKGGIKIPIVTYYSDKGVKAASKGLMALETSALKLAKTFGVTLGAAATIGFGKKALDVFAKEQKAMSQLTNTLYGLGLAYKGVGAEQFLNNVQDATGVAKDELAPALQTLATYTLDYAKSQELLNTALNVSAAGYGDVQTVADALGKAYTGNTKALVGLNAGISTTEAKTETFAQLMKQLNTQFKDAALIDNYQTRLNKLKVAATDAISYIGQGIAEALNTLTNGANIEATMTSIRNFGKVVSEEIVGFAAGIKQLFKDISEIPIVKLILMGISGAIKGIDKLLGISKAAKIDIANFDKKQAAAQAIKDAKALAAAKQQAALNKKLQAQALADQKKLNAEKEKQARLEELAKKYKQAAGIFDLEQIEYMAAALNKQTAEDYARIKLKQDLIALQNAIDAGDLKAAEAAAKAVDEDYKRVQAYQAINIAAQIQAGKIANIAAATSLIPTNLKLIDLDNLDAALKAILAITTALTKLPIVGPPSTPSVPGSKDYGGNVIGTAVPKSVADAYTKIFGNGTSDYGGNPLGSLYTGPTTLPTPYLPPIANGYLQPQNVTVTVVDNTSGLIDVITDATQQASANGINTRLVRNTGGLSW